VDIYVHNAAGSDPFINGLCIKSGQHSVNNFLRLCTVVNFSVLVTVISDQTEVNP